MEESRAPGGVDLRTGSRMDRLVDATAALAHTLGAETLDPIAKATVAQAQALVEARAVLLLLEERGNLVAGARAGEIPDSADDMKEPADGAAWRRVIDEHRAERVREVTGRLAAALSAVGISVRSALLVPLIVRDRAIGVIAAFDRVEDGPEFSEEDEDMLTGFAASAAMAVAPMQAIAETRLRESIEVAERERARWARELHDETLQGLGALRVRLAASLRHGRPERVDQAVREAIAQIEDEIANLRSLITELRPAALDELGLGAAIESLVESHAAATGLELHLDLALAHEDGVSPNRLHRELESAVYRVVQEALTNVAKHANAESVWIEVAQSADSLLIVVRDDGGGFDMNARSHGFGLVGIRERIALQGGSLAIVSSPGAGTEVRGRIPLYSTSSMPRSSA
jgi:signal transduction histidine kinase